MKIVNEDLWAKIESKPDINNHGWEESSKTAEKMQFICTGSDATWTEGKAAHLYNLIHTDEHFYLEF